MSTAALAALLGPDWTADPPDADGGRQTAGVSNPATGLQVYTWGPDHRGRLVFHVTFTDNELVKHWPRYWRDSEWGPKPPSEISVSAKRLMPAIAREIRSRLLPGGAKLREVALAAKASDDDYHARKEANRARLQAAFPGLQHDSERLYYYEQERGSGHFTLGVGISIQIDTNIETAVKVAELLAASVQLHQKEESCDG